MHLSHIARRAATLLAALSLAFGASLPAAPPPAWTLDAALKQLDSAAKEFKSLTASIARTKVTVVVNDTSTESGQIWVRGREKMRIELTNPDPKTILRDGDKLYLFNPKQKRVEEYDLGKNRNLVDQFLLLGFGTSGSDLRKAFSVTLQGEPVLGDRKTVFLELTPKDDKVRQQISRIQLWVDQATWLPVQQKFFETGSGDFFTIAYSDVIKNRAIPDSRFKQDWPRGTQKLKPQG